MTLPANDISGRRRVLFVAGVSRSGSTLLDFVLGNRPDGFSLGEIYAWHRPFRVHHRSPTCACGRRWRECEVWQRIGRPPARRLHRSVADIVEANVVVDSSKNLSWIRDAYRWASANDLDPHVVLSWRPPRALAYSYWKRENGRLSASSEPAWMTNLTGYVRRLDSLRLAYHVVDFDQLIVDPIATLDRLHAGIGLTTWPGQECFWEGQYHSLFGSGGTREQLRSQSAALAKPVLPDEFLRYWDTLPAAWRDSLERLNRSVLDGEHAPPPRRTPPAWYVKSRGLEYRTRVRLAVDGPARRRR